MNIQNFFKDLFDIARDVFIKVVLLVVNIIPGSPGNKISFTLKWILLLIIGIRVGKSSQVSSGFYAYRPGKVQFGRNCSIGSNFKIWNFDNFNVDEKLLASHNVTVICGTHTVDELRLDIPGPVKIGKNVWIGANVLIVGPSNIGDGSIIGANSYVTGEVKSGWIYAGNPARPIRLVPEKTK